LGNLSGNQTHGHRVKPHGTVSLGITISTCTLGSGQREKRDLKYGRSVCHLWAVREIHGPPGGPADPARPSPLYWRLGSSWRRKTFANLASGRSATPQCSITAYPHDDTVVLPRCPPLCSLQHLEIGDYSGEARYLGPYQLHLLLYSASKIEATRAQLARQRFETVLGV